MRDFWIDFGGVVDYLSGDGALRLCFRGDGVGEVLGFEVLSLLAYLGYPLDGHDYDYECSEDGLGYTVGAVNYLNSYVEPSWQMGGRCVVATGAPVAHVSGSLYARKYWFYSDIAVRWVLPVDLLLYWGSVGDNLRVSGCNRGSGVGSYLDVSAVDTEADYMDVVFNLLFWDFNLLCYGARYTRWLLDEFVWYLGHGGFDGKLEARVSLFKDSFALNWDFVMVVGSSSDMDMLRVEFPSLFV